MSAQENGGQQQPQMNQQEAMKQYESNQKKQQ